MADLRKTQAEWTRFLGEEIAGMFLSALFELKELEHRYSKQRTRVVLLNDTRGVVRPGGLALEGVHLSVNTSVDGYLYPRITGPLDPTTVSLYRSPGATDLVARGTGNAGTVVPLTERNGSGLAGSWDLPVAAPRLTSDDVRLFLVPDWLTQLDRVWDGSEPKDLVARDLFQDALERVALNLAASREVILDALALFATEQGSRGAEFLQASTQSLFSDLRSTRDLGGVVTRRRTGFLPTLTRAMRDETRSAKQSVAQRVATAPPARFSPQNRGRGRINAHRPQEYCPAARWTFRCTRGGDTDAGGQEEFGCSVKLLKEDRELSFSGVRVGQSFTGPEGIGPFTLQRVYTKDGDPQDERLASAAGVVTTQERGDNTDNGILHWRLEEPSPGSWDVLFFMSASRVQGELVAKAESVQPGDRFTARERGASGLTVIWRLGRQPVAGAEGGLDCNFFLVENQAGVPDEFEITTRVVEEGLIQSLLAAEVGGAVRSEQAGQATMPDGYVRAGVLASLLD